MTTCLQISAQTNGPSTKYDDRGPKQRTPWEEPRAYAATFSTTMPAIHSRAGFIDVMTPAMWQVCSGPAAATLQVRTHIKDQTAYDSLSVKRIIDLEVSDDEKIHRLLTELATEKPWPYTDDLVDRIALLWEEAYEEGSDQKPLSFQSLHNFISFMKKNNTLLFPSLTLSYDGNINALWHKTKRRHLSVEFGKEGLCGYLLFSPSNTQPEKTSRNSGNNIDIRELLPLVEMLGATQWIYQDGTGR